MSAYLRAPMWTYIHYEHTSYTLLMHYLHTSPYVFMPARVHHGEHTVNTLGTHYYRTIYTLAHTYVCLLARTTVNTLGTPTVNTLGTHH